MYLKYRVIHFVGENLQLTQFRHIRQLVGRYYSCLLPRQYDGTPKTQVNGRFSPTTWVTLYVVTTNYLYLVALDL